MRPAPLLAAIALATAAFGAQAFPGGAGSGPGLHGLKAADTNGDGMISRAEAAAFPRLAERFDQIDANKDGNLSAEELRAHRGPGRGGDRLAKVDTNGDGLIDRAEAQANAPRLAEHFDEVDANKDGVISIEEMRAARHARRR